MAIHHASSGEVIDIRPQGSQLAVTSTLVKTEQLEVIHLKLPAGKEIPSHKVAGPITVQCLEGRVEFQSHGKWQSLETGQLLYLEGGQLHAIKGIEEASVLVTILLFPNNA